MWGRAVIALVLAGTALGCRGEARPPLGVEELADPNAVQAARARTSSAQADEARTLKARGWRSASAGRFSAAAKDFVTAATLDPTAENLLLAAAASARMEMIRPTPAETRAARLPVVVRTLRWLDSAEAGSGLEARLSVSIRGERECQRDFMEGGEVVRCPMPSASPP